MTEGMFYECVYRAEEAELRNGLYFEFVCLLVSTLEEEMSEESIPLKSNIDLVEKFTDIFKPSWSETEFGHYYVNSDAWLGFDLAGCNGDYICDTYKDYLDLSRMIAWELFINICLDEKLYEEF